MDGHRTVQEISDQSPFTQTSPMQRAIKSQESELWGTVPRSTVHTGIAQVKRAAWQRFRSAW